MNVLYKTKRGDAHAVIIIALVVAIIGLLGFVIWQNYLAPKDDKKQETETVEQEKKQEKPVEKTPEETTKTYDGEHYSFAYPKSGWTIQESDYNNENGVRIREVNVQSDDYRQFGMAIESGAIITVSIGAGASSRDSLYATHQRFAEQMDMRDLQKTTKAGMPAVTYHSGYEGMRYHTEFVKDGLIYDIIYRYHDDGLPEQYMDTYDAIIDSFKLK